eukprot:TRINITY_DN8193_c0_g3_i1.p1 TRINITY_DN8193_c0_g3~~TRINITY_DN8193_c0_g3_i1.p1  ORF type:complete len:437 (-),score=103.08 TRINITY_DN8193_c0_g3_i1:314-1624(-)
MSFQATSGAVTQYKRLVRMAARIFYDGECPPEEQPPEEAVQPKRRRTQGDTKGLAVVLLDALVGQEWIQEDKLANTLRIHPKQIRKVLKYLEDERVLAREHHKLKAKREKGEDGEEKEVVENPNNRQMNNLISYVSIDYPMFMDALQLKLGIMKRKLKTLTGTKNQIQKYKCEGCQSEYTAFDAMALYNPERAEFVCYKCNFKVVDSVDGENLTYATDEQRRQSLRSMPQRFDRQLKDLLELVARLKGSTPPDNGTLTDWAEKKREEVMAKEKSPKSADNNKSSAANMPEPQVKVNFENNANKTQKNATQKDAGKKEEPSIQPPWMVKLRQKQLEEAKLSIKGKVSEEMKQDQKLQQEQEGEEGNIVEHDELFKQLQQTLNQGANLIVKTPVDEDDVGHRDKRVKLEDEADKPPVGVKEEEEEESDDDGLDWEEAT